MCRGGICGTHYDWRSNMAAHYVACRRGLKSCRRFFPRVFRRATKGGGRRACFPPPTQWPPLTKVGQKTKSSLQKQRAGNGDGRVHPYISPGLQLKPPLLYLKITLNKTRAALENLPQVETHNGLTYLVVANSQKFSFQRR